MGISIAIDLTGRVQEKAQLQKKWQRSYLLFYVDTGAMSSRHGTLYFWKKGSAVTEKISEACDECGYLYPL